MAQKIKIRTVFSTTVPRLFRRLQLCFSCSSLKVHRGAGRQVPSKVLLFFFLIFFFSYNFFFFFFLFFFFFFLKKKKIKDRPFKRWSSLSVGEEVYPQTAPLRETTQP